jgi:dipeptidyl aminopeptidase/acylaminoacyl peptidase/chloramphenicol 3-O-phosphotransferase/RimJ/RimL family protein N-acetyltransferase
MQDAALQQQTASEPLSLDAEYAMQRSWSADPEKLTFIILDRVDHEAEKSVPADIVAPMVGDVNLFFNDPDDPSVCEMEIMIAVSRRRRAGVGSEAVRLMMGYGISHLGASKFTCKISDSNEPSLTMFGGLGYVQCGHSDIFSETEFEFIVPAEPCSPIQVFLQAATFDTPPRKLAVEDTLQFCDIADTHISPSGRAIAFTKSQLTQKGAEAKKASSVWVMQKPEGGHWGEPYCVASEDALSSSSPCWNPCLYEDQLAFAQTVPRLSFLERLVTVMPIVPGNRGASSCATSTDYKVPVEIETMLWDPSGQKRVCLLGVQSPESADAAEVHGPDEHLFTSGLHLLDVDSGHVDSSHPAVSVQLSVRCVSPAGMDITHIAWSTSGAYCIVVAVGTLPGAPFQLIRLDAAGDLSPVILHSSTDRSFSLPTISFDEQFVSFVIGRADISGRVCGEIAVLGPICAAEVVPTVVSTGLEASFTYVQWHGACNLLACGYEDGGTSIYIFELALSGVVGCVHKCLWSDMKVLGAGGLPAFSTGKDCLCAVMQDATHPEDIWTCPLPEQLSASTDVSLDWVCASGLHPDWVNKHIAMGSTSSIWWEGARGWDIQGLVTKPLEYRNGARYPLVVVLHGGCQFSELFCGHNHPGSGLARWTQLLAAQGAVVFCPNYSGSAGRGSKFLDGSKHDVGGADLEDVMSGIHALVRSGIAQSTAVAVCGWGYGGCMATSLCALYPASFRACVTAAGISDWSSVRGTDRTASRWVDSMMLHGQLRSWRSPILKSVDNRVPTLLIHGKDDSSVPACQALQFHQALVAYQGSARAVASMYPGEGHTFSSRSAVADSTQKALDWISSHLQLSATWTAALPDGSQCVPVVTQSEKSNGPLVIIINGASSSGKTALAQQLQSVFNTEHGMTFFMGQFDDIYRLLPDSDITHVNATGTQQPVFQSKLPLKCKPRYQGQVLRKGAAQKRPVVYPASQPAREQPWNHAEEVALHAAVTSCLHTGSKILWPVVVRKMGSRNARQCLAKWNKDLKHRNPADHTPDPIEQEHEPPAPVTPVLGPAGLAALSALHGSWAAIVESLPNPDACGLIIDHRTAEQAWAADLKTALDSASTRCRTFTVSVKCALDVLEKRELERSDRQAGTARGSLSSHDIAFRNAWGEYDAAVDTTTATSQQCAEFIRSQLLAQGLVSAAAGEAGAGASQ